MKRLSSLTLLLLVGFFSFLIFFYLMFPYGILREAITAKISDLSGMPVRVEKLSPSFPLGVRFEGLTIAQAGRKGIALNRVELSLNPFSLLLASLSATVAIEDANKGTFRAAVALPLWGLITQKAMIPSRVEVGAKNFSISELVEFLLAEQARSPNMSVILAPVLVSIGLQAQLTADIDLQLNSNDLMKSHGKILLDLGKAALISKGADLPIDNQQFSKALIKAAIQNGSLVFDKDSGFTSQDLGVVVSGSVAQKPDLMKSVLDIAIEVTVSDKIKDQFGFIISALSGTDFQHKLTVKITGPLDPRPSVVVL
jgi:type II secretion system protein N